MEITQMLDQLKVVWERNASAIAALDELPAARGTTGVLESLRNHQTCVEDAVVALSRLARVGGKVRGRKPAWITSVENAIAGR